MLDHAQTALKQIVEEFQKIAYAFGIFTQLFYVAYLIYAVAAGAGVVWVNVSLLIFSSAYFCFYVIIHKRAQAKERVKTRLAGKIGKFVYNYGKIALRIYPVALSVYGLYNTSAKPSFLAVLFLCFTLVGWVLQAVFDLLIHVLKNRFLFLKEGLEMDIQEILRPVTAVGNFFKKVTGKEVKEAEPLSERQQKLQAEVQAERERKEEEKKRRKANEKQEKTDEKHRKKQEKIQLKQSISLEKHLLKEAKKQEKSLKKQEEITDKQAILTKEDEQNGEETIQEIAADSAVKKTQKQK